MLFTYKGYRFAGCCQKSAPNFGGTEYWWEMTYRNDEGKEVFATGHTKDDAFERIKYKIDNPLSLPLLRSLSTDDDDYTEEIPF